MDKISNDPAVEMARIVRPLTEIAERELVARLAREVPTGGLIVEVGALYGGMTAVMALANAGAFITTMDNFSWHPEDDQKSSKALVEQNMARLGITNVEVLVGDSIALGRNWKREIDLVWIDGGHTYKHAYSDLICFGSCSAVIAIHDYGNPHLECVKRAVSDFLEACPEWGVAETVHTTAVLRKSA